MELANVGPEPVRLSALTLMLDSAAVPLDGAGEELAAGAHLLVVLDGPQRAEGSTWHAGERISISADAGRAAILDKFGKTIDEVAWGHAPGAVNPFAGGINAEVEPGGSIGRAPGAARLRSALAWAGYPAAEVTPGKANPPVPVRSTHPLSGARTSRSGASLSWFPVPGVTAYQVQVATDESFAKIVLDRPVPNRGSTCRGCRPVAMRGACSRGSWTAGRPRTPRYRS